MNTPTYNPITMAKVAAVIKAATTATATTQLVALEHAARCGLLDLVGSLQEHEGKGCHDWKAHRESIAELAQVLGEHSLPVPPEDTTSAQLMAAAPDLLAALQACIARMEELQKVTNYPLAWPRVQAEAAIAKAEGKGWQ